MGGQIKTVGLWFYLRFLGGRGDQVPGPALSFRPDSKAGLSLVAEPA